MADQLDLFLAAEQRIVGWLV